MNDLIQLPRTATRRGSHSSLLLVQSVDCNPHVPGVLAWQGRHFRTGSTISEETLFEGCPDTGSPVVLEHTDLENQAVQRGRAGRWLLVLILWQYDRKSRTWRELARMFPPCSYSEVHMRRIAAGLIGQDAWRELEPVDACVARIAGFLTSEIQQLEQPALVIDLVLNYLIARLVLDRVSVVIPRKGMSVAGMARACGLRTFG